MDSPFKTPEGSKKFLKNADEIAKNDLGIKDNTYGRHQNFGTKIPAGLSEEEHRELIYGDRGQKIEIKPREPRNLEASAASHYQHLLNTVKPDENGKREFSSLDMQKGVVPYSIIIGLLLKQNKIRETGREIPIKKGTRKVYEII
jgi:hypothetical protein